MEAEIASGWGPVVRETNQIIRELEHYSTLLPSSKKKRGLEIEFGFQWSMS